MTRPLKRHEGPKLTAEEKRERALARIREQIESGELVVRQATPEERASWPEPSAPMPRCSRTTVGRLRVDPC